jgi:hypothetical protein
MSTLRKTIRIRWAGVLILAAAAALLYGPPAAARSQEPDHPPAMDLSPASLPARVSHPKMQAALARLAAIQEREGPAAAADFARIRRLAWSDGMVRVVAETATGDMAALAGSNLPRVKTRIQSLGGRIETTHRNRVQHLLPPSSLRILAEDPDIAYLRLPLRPFKQAVVSEGVSKTGADKWRGLAAFHNGTPARIAILDLGFMGYKSLLGEELPDKVTTRSFRADGDLSASEDHGTACAEIVHDMAPNAELYLVNIDTDVEQSQAVDWLDGKVDVISYSLGWYNAGAGDGTGPICADVAATDATWAVSAGNGALDHWDGFFNDPDSDGLLNFSGADELLDFYVPANETVGAFLNWKDWGVYDGYDYTGSNQDYDLYLYVWNGSSYQYVDSSTADQTGSQWPTEEVFGWYTNISTYWAVAIRRHSGTKNVRLELFAYGNSRAVEYNVQERSVSIPADSPVALAAGATDAVSDVYHSYSGQGPTHDGRLKPDFGSPSGVSTATYGDDNFYGTSASAPHLAGALGLLKGGTPYSMAQIIALLKDRAVDLGDPGPDTKFGYGRLNVKKR